MPLRSRILFIQKQWPSPTAPHPQFQRTDVLHPMEWSANKHRFCLHGEVRPCSQLHQPDTEASQIAEIHLSDRVLQDEGRVRDGEHIVGADSTLHYAAFLPLGRIFAESSPRYFRRAYRNRVARYKERYGRGVPLITTQAIGEELGYSY
jgi:hypothetical protein